MRSVRSATWTSVDPLSVSWVRYFSTVGALSNAILEFALRALLCRGADTGSLNRCKPSNLAHLRGGVKESGSTAAWLLFGRGLTGAAVSPGVSVPKKPFVRLESDPFTRSSKCFFHCRRY